MDTAHPKIYNSNQSRSRSRSRTRNSTTNTRSTSSTRNSNFGCKRSFSLSPTGKLAMATTTTTIDDAERFIPTSQATLDETVSFDFFKQDIIAMVKALRISKWYKRQLAVTNLSVNRISGALTNSIYKLEYKDERQNFLLPTLILRLYGKGLDLIIDRKRELKVLIKLSQKNIGPKLVGIFSNGRFEQFLEGYSPLGKDSIRDEVISQMVGRRMKDLHYKIELDDEDVHGLPTCWKLINKLLHIFEVTVLPSYGSNKEKEIFFMKFDQFKKLINIYEKWLLSHYDTEALAYNYRFCHNDTLCGNLMLCEDFSTSHPLSSANFLGDRERLVINSSNNEKDSGLEIIDFEYSGPNFPAYDLANHFCEWMADNKDPEKPYYIYEEKYPSRLEQLNFIKAYVEYDFQFASSNLKHAFNKDFTEVNSVDLIQFEIKKLYNECILWRPAVQIHWCLLDLIHEGPIRPTICIYNHKSNPSSEKLIDSTYSNMGLDTLGLEENAAGEEEESEDSEETTLDNNFDYLKYAQQKSALLIGDFLQLGLIDKSDIRQEYLKDVKHLNCDFFEL